MKSSKQLIKSVMVALGIITLLACEGNRKNIQQLNLTDGAPIAEGVNINLKYTDSGKVVTNLIAPVLLDYSNFEFPYQEFPNGVEVRFWNEKNEKSTVTSDYAIRFDKTNIVDLRKNVVLITSDSTILRAEQLYWDQANKWVFTDQPYQMKLKDGSYNDGARFDSNEDFTNFLSRKNQGVQIIDQTKTNGE
jgi:LPS export ABC transporter protein LptC